MTSNVGIRFRHAGRIECCDSGDLDLLSNEYVVIQMAKACDVGQVAITSSQLLVMHHRQPSGSVIRKATADDLRKRALYRSKEATALTRCREKVDNHRLSMKLLSAEYTFDGSRLTFFFCADGRVDFRGLVRDLAAAFRTRIELRQVGPRDETKLVGGVARCGRDLCCSSWLRSFSPVSMRMAKNQDLPLTDSRLGGVCGRLMCCLAFENTAYVRVRPRCPDC